MGVAQRTSLDIGILIPTTHSRSFFQLLFFLLLSLLLVHSPLRALPPSLHHYDRPAPARPPPDPYSGACLSSQLALERAGRLKEASQTPYAEASAHPLVIVMPVHPPTFTAALRTLAVAAEPALGWAIFFLFSDSSSVARFGELVAKERPDLQGRYGALDLSRNAQHLEWAAASERAGVWVPYKHYHAMAVLGPCFHFIVPLDNELEWLRPGELLGALREREASPRVFAGYAPRYRPVNIISTWFFKERERGALSFKLRDFNLYSWWSDLPLVLGRDMAPFLAYAGYPAHRISITCFEFSPSYTYELWKVALGEWPIADLQKEMNYVHCGSLETLSRAHYYDTLRSTYPRGPRWINKGFCDVFPASCANNSDLVLIFHTDRGKWALDLAEGTNCNNPVLMQDALRKEIEVLQRWNPSQS